MIPIGIGIVAAAALGYVRALHHAPQSALRPRHRHSAGSRSARSRCRARARLPADPGTARSHRLDRLAVTHAAAMARSARRQDLSAARGGGRHQPDLRTATLPPPKWKPAKPISKSIARSFREQGIEVETAIGHSLSPKREIVRYAHEIQSRPGDHGRPRPRRPEGPDLRQHHQPGTARSGCPDADRAPGKELRVAREPRMNHCLSFRACLAKKSNIGANAGCATLTWLPPGTSL